MTRPPPRVIIDRVRPEIDGGRFPVKRIVGDVVAVDATIFADGHDDLTCRLLYRHDGDPEWVAAPLALLGNDRWRASFRVSSLGVYRYTVEGWIDHLATWRRHLAVKIAAGQDVAIDILAGVELVEAAAGRAPGADARRLRDWAQTIRSERDPVARQTAVRDDRLIDLARQYPDRATAARHDPELAVVVDRERARFSAWYEVFPRSCAPEPGRHGTLRDCADRLPAIAAMGFDVVYLPPVHPIGRTFRKGRNNAPAAEPGDVGSPWAIGAAEGGHTAIHPDLGSLEDFRSLVARARELTMEVAIDLAIQCSPDHPYVTAHPEWFKRRADGTIQYAENPPKKYQDIYPVDFETTEWRALWEELRSVVLFWIDQGVRIFRVDNPHTKALAFWAWLIPDLKHVHPDLIFLSEAFTRPGPMYRLAKLGFTQSYTYFTWRNTKQELTDYLRELVDTDVREFFRPNFWPNTPDILHAYLQSGGRPAFIVRGVLAATLAANYGIYGPAFELCENLPRERGSEEYLHSEKYEIRQRDWDASSGLRPLLTRLNGIRRANAALQSNDTLRFHETDNPQLLCYSKTAPDGAVSILTVVNLDSTNTQSGWVTLDLAALGLTSARPFAVDDLLTDRRFVWQGPRNYVELSPATMPAHVLRLVADPASEAPRR